MLVLTSVSTAPLGLSARSTRCISLDGESARAVEIGLLDEAHVNFFSVSRNC